MDLCRDRPLIADHRGQRCSTIGPLVFCLLALTLFLLSVGLDARTPHFTLLVAVMVVTVVGLLLFPVLYWSDARIRHIRIDSAAYARQREFASIFEHTAEAILLLDDHSTCLGANPAARHLLGAASGHVLGRHFSTFFPERADFARQWQNFLSDGYARGQLQFQRPAEPHWLWNISPPQIMSPDDMF